MLKTNLPNQIRQMPLPAWRPMLPVFEATMNVEEVVPTQRKAKGKGKEKGKEQGKDKGKGKAMKWATVKSRTSPTIVHSPQQLP